MLLRAGGGREQKAHAKMEESLVAEGAARDGQLSFAMLLDAFPQFH